MDTYLPMDKNTVIVEKPSGAIAISTNKNFTALQRKLYDAFLYVAKQELNKNSNTVEFTISLNNVKGFFTENIYKNNKFLKEQILGLMEIIAQYNILNKDKVIHWEAFSILPRAYIEEGIIVYEIPTPVKKAILNDKGVFAKIDLIIIKNLQSRYSIILYEILKDYRNAEIPEMRIEDFRKIFGIVNKYKRFPDLKKRVLDPAIKEINENPHIEWSISYKLRKAKNNKYTHIKFIKTPKPLPELEKQKAQETKNKNYKQIVEQLMQAIPKEHRKKNTEKLLLQALSSKGYEYVEKQIEYTNSANPKQYVAYLRKAIEQDYAGVENSEVAKELQELEKLTEKYTGKTFIQKGKKHEIRDFIKDGNNIIIRTFIEIDDKTAAKKELIVKNKTPEELDQILAKKIDT